MRGSNRGMTLIELMVVVAIVAILASVAYSSYRNSVIRSNRTEAMSALLNVAAAQEKFYLQNNRYADDDEFEDPPPAGLGIARVTASGFYQLAIDDGTADDFTQTFGITATPVAGGGQTDDDDCTALTINEAGLKGATGAADAPVRCWR